jgi:hypothetical protein
MVRRRPENRARARSVQERIAPALTLQLIVVRPAFTTSLGVLASAAVTRGAGVGTEALAVDVAVVGGFVDVAGGS